MILEMVSSQENCKFTSVRLEKKLIHGTLSRGHRRASPESWALISFGLNTSLVLPDNLISKAQKDQTVSK